MGYNRASKKMKRIIFIVAAVSLLSIFANRIYAQGKEMCPCLMEDKIEALEAVANASIERESLNLDMTGPVTAASALVSVGLEAYKSAPSASYYLKVTAGGEIAYSPVSSCQMALEKTYDLLQISGVKEVRIISENVTVHMSCANRTYTPSDLNDVKKRRDGVLGGENIW